MGPGRLSVCFVALPQFPEYYPAKYHYPAEDLTSGHKAQYKADVQIRFPEHFHKDPNGSIANEKETEYAAMRPASVLLPRFFPAEPENAEKEDSFQKHFVKL